MSGGVGKVCSNQVSTTRGWISMELYDTSPRLGSGRLPLLPSFIIVGVLIVINNPLYADNSGGLHTSKAIRFNTSFFEGNRPRRHYLPRPSFPSGFTNQWSGRWHIHRMLLWCAVSCSWYRVWTIYSLVYLDGRAWKVWYIQMQSAPVM